MAFLLGRSAGAIDPAGLILTAMEAARQRAQAAARTRAARAAAARLLSASRPAAR
jgi:hypothetical protein